MENKESFESVEARKKDHIDLSLSPTSQVGMRISDKIKLVHDSIPDADFSEIQLQSESQIFPDSKPFLVSSMTGGFDGAFEINKRLLNACKKRNWIFSTGSLRKELDNIKTNQSEWTELIEEFANDVPIIGNIGIVQIINLDFDSYFKLCEKFKLKAIFVHLNPLQEVLQKEGTTNFKGSVEALKNLAEKSPVPVLLKETGSGISRLSFNKIKDIKLSAVDVSGLGGTHWGRIESLRGEGYAKNAFETFSNWGTSTFDSLQQANESLSNMEIWASGGLRSGVDMAICFALGAKVCGLAQPLLIEALKSEADLNKKMAQFEFELKVALFCSGCASIKDLNQGKLVYESRF